MRTKRPRRSSTTVNPRKKNNADRSAWDHAGRLLAARPLSRFELEQKLLQHGYEEDEVAETLERVSELGWLDDEQTARSWIEGEKRKGSHGRAWVKGKIVRRGIDETLADRLLDTLWSTGDEERFARRVLASELAKTGGEPLTFSSGTFRRIAGALMRRGFASQLVRELLEEAVERRQQERRESGWQRPEGWKGRRRGGS
ncbi:hypothetical protein GF324_12060 [bacterium]|nr:hypothetical protein [bacterium]